MMQAADALAEAHGVGLIHRDIKPANMVLCRRGDIPDVVKLLDFGLVKDIEAPQEMALSATATITGTPLYMAPERIPLKRRHFPAADRDTAPNAPRVRCLCTDCMANTNLAYHPLRGGDATRPIATRLWHDSCKTARS